MNLSIVNSIMILLAALIQQVFQGQVPWLSFVEMRPLSRKSLRTDIPMLVSACDEKDTGYLLDAGASEVISRNRQASLILESHLLCLLVIPLDDVMMRIQSVCLKRYPMLDSFSDDELAEAVLRTLVMVYLQDNYCKEPLKNSGIS